MIPILHILKEETFAEDLLCIFRENKLSQMTAFEIFRRSNFRDFAENSRNRE